MAPLPPPPITPPCTLGACGSCHRIGSGRHSAVAGLERNTLRWIEDYKPNTFTTHRPAKDKIIRIKWGFLGVLCWPFKPLFVCLLYERWTKCELANEKQFYRVENINLFIFIQFLGRENENLFIFTSFGRENKVLILIFHDHFWEGKMKLFFLTTKL